MYAFGVSVLFCLSCHFQMPFFKKGNELYLISRGASKPFGKIWNTVPVCTKFRVRFVTTSYKGRTLNVYMRHKKNNKGEYIVYSFQFFYRNKVEKIVRMNVPPLIEKNGVPRSIYGSSFMEGSWEIYKNEIFMKFSFYKGFIRLFFNKKRCKKSTSKKVVKEGKK